MAAISVFEMSKPIQVELSINHEETVELPDGWLFFYNTKAFLDSGDPVMALAGNGPIFVSIEGTMTRLSSSTPWEEAIKNLSR